ncbi:LuxR C-terminal-related transcriptional regulator [Sphingorhabdus arenilitoris]|uniref:LuxR C-terminal-related transcriptional regulator n=1 Tax=Sphingorhabdus arenilitoris TaxID=1490041 RepID=A0ABV8RH49_9SPHN
MTTGTQLKSGNRKNPILASIEHSPIATVISDPRQKNNPIVASNKAFSELTGYPEEEIIGRNCKFLAGEGTEPWLTEKLREGIAAQKPVLVELLNYKRDGTPFRNAVLIAPAFDDDGVLEYFIGSQVELPEDADAPSVNRHQNAVEIVSHLSPRQKEILQKMAAGFRTKQIAYQLSLSEKTVQMHRMLLFKKLQTSNAADAVRIAVEAGL